MNSHQLTSSFSFSFDWGFIEEFFEHWIIFSKKYHFFVLVMSGISNNWFCVSLIELISTDRNQRIKLANDCYSEWRAVPSGVPQGCKLGPWLFLLMINDLTAPEVDLWKYVDDTTESEIIPRGCANQIQVAVNKMASWSPTNKLQLNYDKCKEIQISFCRNQHLTHQRLLLHGHQVELVIECKLLTWVNNH